MNNLKKLPPQLSVITPTFNCENFITRSYRCLVDQSFIDWEWIVVNDGSTDDSKTILTKLADSDERIKIFNFETNKGRGFARNTALSKCSSDGIVVWDIDDLYSPNRLSLIHNAFKEGYDFFASYALIADTNLNLKGARHFQYGKSRLTPSFVHPTLAFKKGSCIDIGYDQNMRAGEDLEIMLYLEKYCRGFYSKEYLMIYIEDREINLNKTISMHDSHIRSSVRLIENKFIKLNAIEKYKLYVNLYTKKIILQLLRGMPSIYLLSVNLRYKENIQSKLLNENHIKLFLEFSDVSF